MIENLTKENFWNEMQEKYPKAMKKFCDWIDEYKKENNWISLFDAKVQNDGFTVERPKYHDLPIAFQVGIFFEYVSKEIMKDFSVDNGKDFINNWLKYDSLEPIHE